MRDAFPVLWLRKEPYLTECKIATSLCTRNLGCPSLQAVNLAQLTIRINHNLHAKMTSENSTGSRLYNANASHHLMLDVRQETLPAGHLMFSS